MMDDQKVHLLFPRFSNRIQIRIYRPPNPFDLPTMRYLQSVSCPWIIPEAFGLENMITLPR